MVLKSRKKETRKWKKEWLLREKGISGVEGILKQLEPSIDFNNYLRMDKFKLTKLLSMIYVDIVKKDTNMRLSITPKEKLVTTLRYLATGESFTSLAYQSRLSKQAISYFVPEVCEAIYKALNRKFLMVSQINYLFMNEINYIKNISIPDSKHPR